MEQVANALPSQVGTAKFMPHHDESDLESTDENKNLVHQVMKVVESEKELPQLFVQKRSNNAIKFED